MRRPLLMLVIVALSASSALAANTACTTQMVTGGFCPNTSHRLFYFPIPNTDPDGAGPEVGLAVEIADAICDIENYQPTVEDGAPNPESCVQFADRKIKDHFREMLRRYRDAKAEADKQAALAANPVPELP